MSDAASLTDEGDAYVVRVGAAVVEAYAPTHDGWQHACRLLSKLTRAGAEARKRVAEQARALRAARRGE